MVAIQTMDILNLFYSDKLHGFDSLMNTFAKTIWSNRESYDHKVSMNQNDVALV